MELIKSKSEITFRVRVTIIKKEISRENLVLRNNFKVRNKKKNKTVKNKATEITLKGGSNNIIENNATNNITVGNILKGIFRASFFISSNHLLQEIYF